MGAPLAKILSPVFAGFKVSSLSVVEPRIDWFSVDPTSIPIRWGDPVTQIAGGNIVRATPATTALLGIAATASTNMMPASIATMPIRTDIAGNPQVPVYLADALTRFRGKCTAAPQQSNILKTQDLCYALADALAPTPTITNGGTAGSTSYTYKITAFNQFGETAVGAAGTTATGNATLSATNYNIVTIPLVAGVTSFGVYRGGTNLIAIVPASGTGTTVFNDIGNAIISTTVPGANMTGWLINLSATSTNVAQIQSLDTTPQAPLGATPSNCVLWTIPAAKSQIGNVSGS